MNQAVNHSSGGKSIFALILGIPVFVILASSILYWMADQDVVELGTVNHGNLIQPPRPMMEQTLTTPGGETLDIFDQVDSRWIFMVVGGARCEDECERMLYLSRQTHVAMGKKMPRIQRMYLSTSETLSPELADQLAADHDDMRIAHIDAQAWQTLIEGVDFEFPASRRFYVVDPYGWLMMSHGVPDTELPTLTEHGKKVLKDMKRLLK